MADKLKELNADVEELRSLLKTATRQKVKDALSIEIRKIETAIIALKESDASLKTESNPAQTKVKPANTIPVIRSRDYAWDQSDKFVKFYLTMPGVHSLDEAQISMKTTPSSCTVQANFTDKSLVFNWENLLHEILPEKSYHKVKTDQVVVLLKKTVEAKKWTHVTATEKQLQDAREAKKMESFAKDKPADDSDPAGGIMQLMKKMYQDGDDDMKRSIAQAWTQAQNKKDSMEMMPGDL